MKFDDIAILEMLSLVYEDMDIDTIEGKFVDLVSEVFSFDRVGLFFAKHKKGVLQGKLCKGFEAGAISSLSIPIEDKYLFSRPLVTGFPVWDVSVENDIYATKLGLQNFALIPIVNKKRVSCWQIKECNEMECPAYGNKWLRCRLVPGTRCSMDSASNIEEKTKLCSSCPVCASQSVDSVEGVMLVDNSLSNRPIGNDTITILSIVAHAVGVAINNSKLYTKTLKVAIKDDLTGLHNRRYFNERLMDELERAKRYDGSMSLLMADIDHFKRINDTYGHPTGDGVLCWIGNLLRKELRQSDVVARYGGEEFAILLINTRKNQAMDIAEELRSAIETTSERDNNGIRITTSFGVASFGEDATSLEGLIAKADKALYFAKAQGRNRVRSP